MNLIQLPTPLPVRIVGGRTANHEWAGPTGDAMAIGWCQPSLDWNIIWICVLDETGQCWEVENPFVRFRRNITWGRNQPEKGQPAEDYGPGF